MSQSKLNRIRGLVKRLMGAEVSKESPVKLEGLISNRSKSKQPDTETAQANSMLDNKESVRKFDQRQRGNQSAAARLVYDPVAKCIRLANSCDPEQTHPKITCSDMHVD